MLAFALRQLSRQVISHNWCIDSLEDPSMNLRRTSLWFALVMTAGVVGCSTAQPPRETVAAADVAVKRAQSSRASESAPVDLRLALDKLDRAKAAMSQKEYTSARRLAEEALVDAQVAEAKTGSDQAHRTVIEAQRTLDNLRNGPRG
jgi:hypothetical protein